MTKTKEENNSVYGYNINTQKMMHINEAQNGLKCECFDPNDLTRRLIAKQGTIKKHHFAYYNEEGENNGNHQYICNESKEHKAAKMNIVRALRINSTPPVLLKEAKEELHTHYIKKYSLRFVPDIQAITTTNELIFIEIVKCNDITAEKLEKIKREDITTIRIYINDNYKEEDIVDINFAYIAQNSLMNNLYKKAAAKYNEQKNRADALFISFNTKCDECEIVEKERKEAWKKFYNVRDIEGLEIKRLNKIINAHQTLLQKEEAKTYTLEQELELLKKDQATNEEFTRLKYEYTELKEQFELLSV